jgi:hypothetical protein
MAAMAGNYTGPIWTPTDLTTDADKAAWEKYARDSFNSGMHYDGSLAEMDDRDAYFNDWQTGGQRARDAYEKWKIQHTADEGAAQIQTYKDKAKEWGQEWDQSMQLTPGSEGARRADQVYAGLNDQIGADEFAAGEQGHTGYNLRGLGGSGYDAANAQQIRNQASAMRVKAREQARATALGEQAQRMSGKWQAIASELPADLAATQMVLGPMMTFQGQNFQAQQAELQRQFEQSQNALALLGSIPVTGALAARIARGGL